MSEGEVKPPRLRPPRPWAPVLAALRRIPDVDPALRGDLVVVLGARVFADGSLSRSLTDRVTTASELVTHGHAPVLLVSGGLGDGPVHETTAMAELARTLGVAPERIERDLTGVSTRATCAAVRRRVDRAAAARVLAVTHAWHLPRTLFELRRLGINAEGVPAVSSGRVRKTPLFIGREVVACLELWAVR
jgi:SanA protein